MAPLSRTSFITRTGFSAVGALAASGSSVVDGWAGASIDTANVEGVLFIQGIVSAGTSATATFSVRQSTAAIVERSSGGQGTALTGAAGGTVTTSSGQADAWVIDVYKPRRFGTANFLFGQIVCGASCSIMGHQYAIAYGWRQVGNSTATGTVPQTTASANGITGGVTFVASPST